MYKTAEAVSPAHPDKISDQISDKILTEYLKNDPNSRVAIETLGGHGKIYIVGEVTSSYTNINIQRLAKIVLEQNGYDYTKYEIIINIVNQSPEIAIGVDNGGAGDQGIMVGYANCYDNYNYIPFELYESKRILKELWKKYGIARDAKSQVTTKDGKITTIVVSAEKLKNQEIQNVLNDLYKGQDINFIINKNGYWENGGYEADTGLTGRKLAVDNYGPEIEIGGGAFSGKDYSKVDRSGAYIARNLAINLIKQFDFKEVKVKIAYGIGIEYPLMISIETNLGNYEIENIQDLPLSYKEIKEYLELDKQDYYKTAKWGHFGEGFIWDTKLIDKKIYIKLIK